MPPTIAFEGPDGAGKSTVLERVAALLRERGTAIHCPREGKQPRSRIARRIRELTRAVEHLELDPVAEFALYCAREAQVAAESVAPARARGEQVLLDRTWLTPLSIAMARGLDRRRLEPMIEGLEGLAGERETQTVLLFDVDLRTARQRKRIAKVIEFGFRLGGRKGLAGSGFKAKIHQAYASLRADRPEAFIRIPAERADPDTLARMIVAWLEGAPIDIAAIDQPPWWRCDRAIDLDDPEQLAAALDRVPERLALWLGRGLASERGRRALASAREPELVALCRGPDESQLVTSCFARAPLQVLASLRGRALLADDPRLLFVEHEPVEVARSLTGVEGSAADQLRAELLMRCTQMPSKRATRLAGALVESVSGRSDGWAQGLRETHWASADVHERAISLRKLSGEWATRARAELFDHDPARGLLSVRGLEPGLAEPFLDRWAALAPKPALAALQGRTDPSAAAWRERLFDVGEEVIASLGAAIDPASWDLRTRALEAWPVAVADGLASLPVDHPARAPLLARLRERARGDLELHCRLALLAQREAASVGPR